MINAHNSEHQPAHTPPPVSHSRSQFLSRFQRFNFSRVPVIAQLSGVLSLLLIGAGLLTVNQLAQNSQDLQSQAATGNVKLDHETHEATLTFGQEKTFNITATTTPANLKASATVLRIQTEQLDLIDVLDITPVEDAFPVKLKNFALEDSNNSFKRWAITLGAQPNETVSGANKKIATVKVKAKEKAGTAYLAIHETSEVAAFDNSGNVNKVLTDQESNDKFLVITVAEENTSADACISKTAGLVNTNTNTVTPLAANAKVKRGDTIEYKVTFKHKPTTTSTTLTDILPAHLEYVLDSAKIDGVVTEDLMPVVNNKLTFTINMSQGDTANHVLSYQARVKNDAPLTEFTNTASLAFNGNAGNPDTNCKMTLGVSTATPPPTTDPTLRVGFRLQGVTKAAVSQPTEVIIRYKLKGSGQVVTKTYNQTFTSIAAQPAEQMPVGTLTAEPIALTGVNLSQIEKLPTSGTFGTGIEVYVKTQTSLRKKLGEVTYENNQAPVKLKGIFVANNQVLMVGDFDRSQTQINKFQLTDVSRMINHYTQISAPVTEQTKEFDINHDGTFNILDVSTIIDNYSEMLIEGDTP